MANKLVIFASSFLIFALLLQASTAAAGEEHIRSYLFPGDCDISSVYACMFYLSGVHSEKEAAGRRFNPFEDGLEKQRLSDCCEELGRLEQECRCTAIEQTVKQQLQNRCGDEEEKMDVVRAAINLPERCQLQPRLCIVSFTGSPTIC